MTTEQVAAVERIKAAAAGTTDEYVRVFAGDLADALTGLGADAPLAGVARSNKPSAIMHVARRTHLAVILAYTPTPPVAPVAPAMSSAAAPDPQIPATLE